MTFKTILLAVTLTLTGSAAQAAEDYKTSEEYQTLRETMRHAFNDGDSARFFPALKNLQDYLLKQNDLHGYYTQRCNEIVFLMNRQRMPKVLVENASKWDSIYPLFIGTFPGSQRS